MPAEGRRIAGKDAERDVGARSGNRVGLDRGGGGGIEAEGFAEAGGFIWVSVMGER